MLKDAMLAIIAAFVLMTCAVLGVTGNVVAVTWDQDIDYVTLMFNDTTTATVAEDGQFNVSENATSIILFDISADYLFANTPNTTETMIIAMTIITPDGEPSYRYATSYGEWYMEAGSGVIWATGMHKTNESFSFTLNGYYEVYCEQWLLINGTMQDVVDEYDFRLLYGYVDLSTVEIGMGDSIMVEYSLGIFGLIGFIATPMITAKLMGGRDPIVIISAFLICMIMFGTFIYVFLLGGG